MIVVRLRIDADVASGGDSGLVVVRVGGEVDLASAPELADALERWLPLSERLAVDLGGCTFIDSAGLDVLVQTQAHAERLGRRLALVGVQRNVQRLLELAELDRLFAIAATVEDAFP